MTITLITGGNKGLGREAARRLIGLRHTVYLGAHDAGRGQAAADAIGAEFLLLDVTDDESVGSAAAELTRREGRLDVLINNAGGVRGDTQARRRHGRGHGACLCGERLRHRAHDSCVPAAAPRLHVAGDRQRRQRARLVRGGHRPATPQSAYSLPVYGSSKAAVAMLTVQYAKGLPDLRINVANPGFTATDLNGNTGHQTVEEGTDAIVRPATIGPDGRTGTFSSRTGPVPW